MEQKINEYSVKVGRKSMEFWRIHQISSRVSCYYTIIETSRNNFDHCVVINRVSKRNRIIAGGHWELAGSEIVTDSELIKHLDSLHKEEFGQHESRFEVGPSSDFRARLEDFISCNKNPIFSESAQGTREITRTVYKVCVGDPCQNSFPTPEKIWFLQSSTARTNFELTLTCTRVQM